MHKLQLKCLAFFVFCPVAAAIEPAEVVLLVNRNVPESAAVAEHYRAMRELPKDNLIELDLPKGEDIDRKDYDLKRVVPLRAALKDREDKIKVLLCIYGVPLRVGGKEPGEADKSELAALGPKLKKSQDRVKELDARIKQLEPGAKKEPMSDAAKELAKARD